MKSFSLALVLLLSTIIGFAQFDPSSWRQIESNPNLLKSIPEQYEKDYKSNFNDSIDSEYKSYHRFQKYWHNRIGIKANGDYSYEPYLQSVLSYAANPICGSSDAADWQLMGPSYHPEQQQGLFTEVLYDADFPDRLLASTNHGGIWKFNPSTDKWYCVTDSLRVPGLSANDFLRSPFNSDIIFAATGNGQWHTEYGVGLLVSTNRGESWVINQSFLNHTGNQYARLIRILPDPSDSNPTDGIDLIVAGTKEIYIGNNNGNSWQTLSPPLILAADESIYDMEITNNGDILVGTTGGYGSAHLHLLRNGLWQVLLEENNCYGTKIKVSTPSNDTVFAVKDKKIGSGEDAPIARSLYISTNGGLVWSMIKESIESGGPKCEIEYSSASDRLYAPGEEGLFVISRSSGNILYHFVANYDDFHADVRDIHICSMINGIEKVYVANDGGISEVNFNVSNPTESNVLNKNGSYLPCNNVIGLAVSNSLERSWFTSAVHQGTFSFSDRLLKGNRHGDGEDGVYNPIDKEIYYTNYAGEISSSKGELIHFSPYYNNGSFMNMRMEINPNNPELLYFGLKERLGMYNENTEQTTYYNTISTNNDTMSTVGAIGVSKDNDIYIAENRGKPIGEKGIFMVSNNSANTWEDKSLRPVWHKVNEQWVVYKTLSELLTWNHINGIACNPDNNNELWIAIGRIRVAESFRVLHSTDGGDNWYDYSEGLPPFPAIDFLYHHETETLFLGTDVGVFYRHPFNDQNGEWSCFSEGLPVGAVTEMEINECTNELFVSMQSRSVFATPIPFNIVNSETETLLNGQLITDANEIWNTSFVFDGDVLISNNAKLTINETCYFTEGSKIIVLPGGELIVNAKLTNYRCNGPWQGIQVSGNSNQSQIPSNQGVVYLNSNAIIKNAQVGVATYQFNNNGIEIENSYGGIIIANGAKFINNRIGCEIKLYQHQGFAISSLPEINNCEFYTDEDYYGLFSDYKKAPRGIKIVNNNKIRIINNTFTSSTTFVDYRNHPYGILKYNSQAIIRNNTFNSLRYGIYSQDYYPGASFDDISGNTFRINAIGIYENGVTGSQIYSNIFTFQIENGFWPYSGAPNIIGVYKNACSNYIFDENTFRGKAYLHDETYIGLLINNGGSNDQLIYKNNFKEFDYAILAQGKNRNTSGSSGLSFKCNNMTFENNDISVSSVLGSYLVPGMGIATAQGSGASGNTQAAGNLFNNDINLPQHYYPQSHFWNLSQPNVAVTYHHHTSSNPSDYDRLIPGNFDTSLINGVVVAENDESVWSLQNSCPSHLQSSGKEEKLASAYTGMSSTETSLNALVDAGDTPEMKQEVQSAQSSQAYDLYNELLNSSPYLSNEVLESATQKEEVLTNPLIRDVLVANPHSAKDEEVLNMIDSRDMPDYMKEQIINGQAIISAKEQMEAKLHQQRMDYNNTLSLIVAEYLDSEHENYSIDNAKQLLANAKNIDARYQLAGLYFSESNTQALATTLNSINNDFDLSQSQSQELSDMNNYFSIINQLKADGRQANDLSNTEISELNSIYENSDNKAAIYARNLLLQAGVIEYEAPVILPNMNNKSALVTTQANVSKAQQDPVFVQVYPNPAKDYIIFEYDIAGEFGHAQVIIYHGSKGEQMRQISLTTAQNSITIDVKDLKPGAYLASLQIDGKTKKSIKFTIAK